MRSCCRSFVSAYVLLLSCSHVTPPEPSDYFRNDAVNHRADSISPDSSRHSCGSFDTGAYVALYSLSCSSPAAPPEPCGELRDDAVDRSVVLNSSRHESLISDLAVVRLVAYLIK